MPVTRQWVALVLAGLLLACYGCGGRPRDAAARVPPEPNLPSELHGVQGRLVVPSQSFDCTTGVELFLVLENRRDHKPITLFTRGAFSQGLIMAGDLRIFDSQGREKRCRYAWELRTATRSEWTTLPHGGWVGIPIRLQCSWFELRPGVYRVRVSYSCSGGEELEKAEGLKIWRGKLYAGEALIQIVARRAGGRQPER